MAEKIRNGEPVILLVQGKDGRLRAVTGMEPDGKLNTVDPTKENSDKFLEINPSGNVLENFFKKFAAQYEKPSHTGLYALALGAVDKVSGFLEKIIGIDPGDKVLDPYRVQPPGEEKEQSQGRYQPLDLGKVDWKEADKLGIPRDELTDALKAMAYGHKSPALMDIKTEIDGKEYTVQARLSLEQQPDGSIKVVTHPKQEQPDFDKPFMGVTFTKEDVEQFKQTGNGGRVFDLEPAAGGEKIPSLVSIDKLTNRFEAQALADISIPQKLKGVELTAEQQEGLKSGKGVLIEGMDKRIKEGEEPSKIDRIVQYNASNRNFDFRFTSEQREQYRQQRQARQGQDENQPLKARKVGEVWVRPVQGGVELSREQFKQLCEGKPVFVEGMQRQQPKPKEGDGTAQQVEATDKKGQKYNAWVWPDAEAGRVRHTSKHPDEWKAIQAKKAATPDESHKTQVAVNSEGKTNEATKHTQEPLKKGQTQPTEKQAEKEETKQQQRQSPSAPRKSKGRSL